MRVICILPLISLITNQLMSRSGKYATGHSGKTLSLFLDPHLRAMPSLAETAYLMSLNLHGIFGGQQIGRGGQR